MKTREQIEKMEQAYEGIRDASNRALGSIGNITWRLKWLEDVEKMKDENNKTYAINVVNPKITAEIEELEAAIKETKRILDSFYKSLDSI